MTSPGTVVDRRVRDTTVLVVAAFGAFLAFLDATIVNVAFPSIQASFPEATISRLSWVLNAYTIVFAAFLVPAGRMADLLGRRRTFALGVLVFTVASVLCGLAPSVEFLIAVRGLQALGAALLVPASLALVVDAFPADRRTHAVGLWGAAAAVAAGLGPPLGGALVEWGDWRWAFFINLPFGIAAYLLTKRTLVESRAPGRRRIPDLMGALLATLALAALTLAIVQGNEWGWASAATLGAIAVCLLAAVGFVWSSRRHAAPVIDPDLLRLPAFGVANLATITAGLGFYAYLLTNILWLQYVWEYSVLQAGLAVAPGAFIAAITTAALGPVAERIGYRPVVVVGALIWAGAFLWYRTQVGLEPDFLGEWLPGQVISGIGVGATLPLLGSAALIAVPGGRYATASAVVSSSRQVGGALGIAILVALLGTPSVDSLRAGWTLCVVVFLLTAVLALLLRRAEPVVEEAVDEPATVGWTLPADGRGAATGAPTAPLLDGLPAQSWQRMQESADRVRVPAGEWLFHAGDPGDALYVVVGGRLEVVRDGIVVEELTTGSVLGELALFTGAPRAAAVRARRDSDLLRISAERFDAVLAADPAASRALAAGLAARLQRSAPVAATVPAPPRLIALCGLHPGAPVEPVAAALIEQMGPARTAWLRSEPAPEELERWESEHHRVLLSAPPEDAERTRSALAHADRRILVADASLDPAGLAADAVPGGAELVLVGTRPPDERITAWADRGPWAITIADPKTLEADLAATARRLAGDGIGLVLAGGGARAFAHLGVLAELAEAGIAVDRVAGCSVGAVVAGLHAAGYAPDEAIEICYAEFVRRNPFADYGLPTVSLSRGRRHRRLLDEYFGGRRIEALPRQFRAVSTDLLGRERVAHRDGDLSAAVKASLALPVLFPPLRDGNRLLVDGGVLDNMPVGLLTERAEGPVIAVNISMGGGSGRRREGPPRMPGLGDTLLRTMMIGSGGANAAAAQVGIPVVTPPTLGVGLLEFHQLDRMVLAGRMAGRHLLESLGPDLRVAAEPAASG